LRRGKKITQEIVCTNYTVFPGKDIRDPKLYTAVIARNVSALVEDGCFLHGGKDANVQSFI
jgi:hypothetical protein